MAAGQDIGGRLRVAWNRRLYQWWHHYNEEYLDGALRPPLIGLSQAESEHGHWETGLRRLSISARHIAGDPWVEVMETLRHEMAHQYADEVLQARDERPHGPAFQRAGERLRCRGRQPDEASAGPDEHRVLRVLHKLLSLAASPNEHEAQAAVKKARRLLLEYNLEVVAADQARGFGTRCLGPVKARRTASELWLAALLQDFFFVEVLWVPTYEAAADRGGTVLQIYGTPANLDMAEYVHGYLTSLLEPLWQDYRRRQGLAGNRERQRYWAGVLEGFHGKLKEQERHLYTSTALVWKGDSRLRDYYRYLNPRVQTRYGRGVRPTQAYRHGLEEGRQVRIHRPLASQGPGLAGYLSE